jgi:hypothetical protein
LAFEWRRHLSVVAAWIAVAGCAAHGAPSESSANARPYVVMVSFDAFRHDYIDRYHPPALEDIARRGIRTSALIPSFPSKTFPNHYTLVTGLYPGHHGIVGNIFFDPATQLVYRNNDSTVRQSRWYGGEPIWVTAERNGVKAGVYFWPGSEALIGGMHPTYWNRFDGKVSNADRVDGVVAWMRKPAADRPHLLLAYFNEVDDTTHHFGPDAPQTAVAVAGVDRALRRLLDSIAVLPIHDSVNVVVVSDHGMTLAPPSQVIPVVELLLRGGIDTAGVLLSDNGPTMSLWFHGDSARVRRARAALGASLRNARAYLRAETPARWHVADNPKFGDLMLVAEDGFTLQRTSRDKAPNPGAHGYDPQVVNMQGVFLAAGPNVRPLGVIAPVENVNVYPFVAALLRLKDVPAVDGSLDVLRGAVR